MRHWTSCSPNLPLLWPHHKGSEQEASGGIWPRRVQVHSYKGLAVSKLQKCKPMTSRLGWRQTASPGFGGLGWLHALPWLGSCHCNAHSSKRSVTGARQMAKYIAVEAIPQCIFCLSGLVSCWGSRMRSFTCAVIEAGANCQCKSWPSWMRWEENVRRNCSSRTAGG